MMLCRKLLRCRQLSNLLRAYHPYTYDNSFNNRVLDYDLIPPIGRLDFAQNENEYFHKLLASDKRYVNTIAFLDYLKTPDENCVNVDQVLRENFEEKPAYSLLCYLKFILKSCQEDEKLFENPRITTLCEVLSSKISELRDEHFWNLMKVLTLWPNKEEDQQFFDLCKTIDEEAVKRSRGWGYDSVLLTMDHFYRLRTLRYSSFVFDGMKRLWRNPGKLTPQQVVHAMFLVKTYKKWHQAVDLLDVECVLRFYIYDLSVEEIGVLAIAFFKTQTPVKDVNLVELMFNKLETRMDDVDSHTLVAFLKFFRLCTDRTLVHKIKHVLERLSERIDQLPIPCCTHIALLGVRQLVFHEPTIRKICERFYDETESLRLKDIERLAVALQRFNYIPESRSDILEHMMESIRKRDTEIERFPRTFISALYFFSLMNCYDYELCNRALSADFLKKTFGSINSYSIPLNVVHLSIGLKLERPNYKGNNLDENFLNNMSAKVCQLPAEDKKKLDHAWLDIFSLRNTVNRILGDKKYALMLYMFPYSPRPDIIFCKKDERLIEIPATMSSWEYAPMQPLPDLGGQWYAVVLISKWNVVNETNQLTGSIRSKLRHLRLLGMKTIQVDEEKYQRETDKLKYVRNLIDSHKSQ